MSNSDSQRRFFLCIKSEAYPASLELGKVYQEIQDETATAKGFVRIVDESGEDYLYPSDLFIPVELPKAAVDALMTA